MFWSLDMLIISTFEILVVAAWTSGWDTLVILESIAIRPGEPFHSGFRSHKILDAMGLKVQPKTCFDGSVCMMNFDYVDRIVLVSVQCLSGISDWRNHLLNKLAVSLPFDSINCLNFLNHSSSKVINIVHHHDLFPFLKHLIVF